MQRLYLAPGQLLDYCDSSGCLPGQIPLKGVSHGSYTPKAVNAQMSKVRARGSCVWHPEPSCLTAVPCF